LWGERSHPNRPDSRCHLLELATVRVNIFYSWETCFGVADRRALCLAASLPTFDQLANGETLGESRFEASPDRIEARLIDQGTTEVEQDEHRGIDGKHSCKTAVSCVTLDGREFAFPALNTHCEFKKHRLIAYPWRMSRDSTEIGVIGC
jgi:hypothetical protein